uniref:Cysteine and tyrosine-rich protein 1 n=1 Tax=Magallana gigas TaxID=29159 RepID=A0A8W8M2H7_MAGGI
MKADIDKDLEDGYAIQKKGVWKLILVFLTVPAKCASYCYYYFSYTYYTTRQLCYYYYYDSDSSAGAIAGGVIGGIVALAVICTIVICVCVKVCKTQNHGQVLVYPQQPAVYTSSTTQQGYSQPPAPVYPYPPPTYSSGQQVFSYSG